MHYINNNYKSFNFFINKKIFFSFVNENAFSIICYNVQSVISLITKKKKNKKVFQRKIKKLFVLISELLLFGIFEYGAPLKLIIKNTGNF